ncbi:MAG: DNA adenine methylase [Lachnospiraceae bacterium]|nr:DNA adenine methylase [Lachnospiraceae bacterium]
MRFIGSKTLLLENIKNVIDENVKYAEVFCDIFSGTSVVANFFKKNYKIISNDLLYFSYVVQKATIENNKTPIFANIPKITNPVNYLNNLTNVDLEKLPMKKRFFQNNYSPIGKRMYLTEDNALRIDFARNKVEDWYKKGYIVDSEYYYLIATIIEGIPFVSNISGTYGAYNKKWDKRAFKKFELKTLPVVDNKMKNKSYNVDGVKLLKRINGDILYIDPPYNERQYLPNYHLLETAAKYDNPIIKGITGQRDYSENEKSVFCNKVRAIISFEEMMKNAKFRHIIFSYSTEGLMNISDIEYIMKKYGIIKTYKLYKIPYRRFKSREQKNKKELNELLFYIEKDV